MSDPCALLPHHLDGIYRRFARHLADDAIKLGWIPAPGRIYTLCDEYVVWMRGIECACGRIMPPLPLEDVI